MSDASTKIFKEVVGQISSIGFNRHAEALLEHAKQNLGDSKKSVKDLAPQVGDKARSGIIISAGPSVYRKNSIKRILESAYKGTVIAVDGAYIACLKAGLIPDFVVTLDPHETRIVRWFGDHEFEKHSFHDDYFKRQDLDEDFKKDSIEQNKRHIELVNKYGRSTKAIVCSSSPRNVVERLKEAQVEMYWWNPLVDNPYGHDSLTRKLYDINKLTCFNTGGTVGTAAWVFADSILKIPQIAVVGMDFGYYSDTPKDKTQTYYELIEHLGDPKAVEECFVDYTFPLTKEKFYADPTYSWYRSNFLELLRQGKSRTVNCTEGGTVFDNNIACLSIEDFAKKVS